MSSETDGSGGSTPTAESVRGSASADSSPDSTTAGTSVTVDPGAATSAGDQADEDAFGTAGWVLVAAVVVSTLVIPGIIYVYPYVLGSFGMTFFGTYLVLPLIPAAILGFIAVWSMSKGN